MMDYFGYKELKEKIDSLKCVTYSLETVAKNIRNHNTDDSDADELDETRIFIETKLNEFEQLIEKWR